MTAIGLDEVFSIHDAAMVINQLHESEAPTYRWVMSTTTHVFLASGVPERLADQGIGAMTVAYVTSGLLRSAASR